MEDEVRKSPANELRAISVKRNVFTSYGHYHNDRNYGRESVVRSYSVQPGIYREDGTVRFDSPTNLCKSSSPIAPATTPSLQTLPDIKITKETPEPRVSWRDFLIQLNEKGQKSMFSRRPGFDDVRSIQHKYSHHCKQKTPLQVLPTTRVPAPCPTKYTSSSTPRPYHLKPLDSQRKKKRNKQSKDLKVDLDISGNGLFCPVSDPLPNKDYTPGFVKVKHHDCYRCVHRMSAHDHHSWIQAFNFACRIRKLSQSRGPKASGEHLLCVKGSKDKFIINETVGNEVGKDGVQGQIVPHTNFEDNSATDSTIQIHTSKQFSKKRGSLIRAGKISERHGSNLGDPNYLSSIMMTMPINVEFLKNFELNNLTHTLKGAQSLTMAIEYNRKNRRRMVERKSQKQQKSVDLAIASSFTMLTQSESLTKIHKEQDQLRELSFSIMEEANTLYRPDSILSLSDGQISNRLPFVVLSETDLGENNEDHHLNKNTSANNEIDSCINSTDTGGPNDSLEDPDASSKEQPMIASIKSSKDCDLSCYWVSTSEMVHPINELYDSGAERRPLNIHNAGQNGSTGVQQVTEHHLNEEEEDSYLEEDDDEEEESYYDLRSFPYFTEKFPLPTGKFLCYTAMTDKRYNKWSRQKRKGSKKKAKKREKEEKCSEPDDKLPAFQEAYLRNLEAIYRYRVGSLKYNHDKANNNVVTSHPESYQADVASSKVSLTASKSGSRVQTVSSTSPTSRNSDTCKASYSFADDVVEDELKMLCTSSNSDQFMPNNGRWDSPQQEVPSDRALDPLITIPSTTKKDILQERPEEDCKTTKEPGVGLPELVPSVAAVKMTGYQRRIVPSHTYIASVQRQILDFHRQDLFNGRSLICPLYVNLPVMDMKITGKGQTGVSRSAPVKVVQPLDRMKKSPRYIPRITGVRISEDPVLCVVRGKKAHSIPTQRPKPKRRGQTGEELEAITIHDLLTNLNSSAVPSCCKTKKHRSNQSPCQGQTFREIYGKTTGPTGNHRNSLEKQKQERSLSSLSISQSVTFSVLPTPDFYKIPQR